MPLGTTNNFARTLGIPLTLAGAIGVLAGGKVADVDLGRAWDTVFATWSAPDCQPKSPPACRTTSNAWPAGPRTR